MEIKKAIEWLKAISATQNDSPHKNSLSDRKEALYMAIVAIEELEQYREIGSIKECREARERQKSKKPKGINKVDEDTVYMECTNCGLTTVLYSGMEPDYCPKCGQAIDWSRDDGGEE